MDRQQTFADHNVNVAMLHRLGVRNGFVVLWSVRHYQTGSNPLFDAIDEWQRTHPNNLGT